MSLVRFLPTPSDRMGIIWSLLAVQGAIVLEYGGGGFNAIPILRAVLDAAFGG